MSYSSADIQDEGTLSKDAALSLRNSYQAKLTDALSASASYSPPLVELDGQWHSTKTVGERETELVWPGSPKAQTFDTGVGPESLLREVGRASVSIPEAFVSANLTIGVAEP